MAETLGPNIVQQNLSSDTDSVSPTPSDGSVTSDSVSDRSGLTIQTKKFCVGDGTPQASDYESNQSCSGESIPTRDDFNLPNGKNISLRSYLYTELTRGYYLENDEAKFAEKRQRVYTFMTIPRELEKFMTYGFFQCVDAFLYMFTFLPVRFFMAILKVIVKGCIHTCLSRPGRVLEPAEICDVLKGAILIICIGCMSYVDVSMMYHIVRGQAIIKLYIFFNMLEVADRLFSSFGQDILDSLFWTATEPRGKRREHVGVIPHLLLAIIIVFLHAILVLFQATTLNVAFNSHNKALLTIMMSNNFVELKGSVFKKFEKKNLFQMSCSDVRERFHFLVLLTIVCMRNLTEFAWNMDHFWVLIPDVVMVLVSEVLVDWVKHAFITKFNEIPAEVYREYTVSIAYDMAAIRQKKAFSDHLDVVSRRMGLIPLPLAVLLIRIVWQSVRITTYTDMALAFLFYLCLTSFKVLNSIVLLGKACDYIKQNKEQKDQSRQEQNSVPTSPKREWTTTATSPSKPTHKRQSSDTTSSKSTSSESTCSATSKTDSILITTRLNRSASFSSKMNVTFCDMPETLDSNSSNTNLLDSTLGLIDSSIGEPESLPTSGSMTPKNLMSNSTVSLHSVCLNEDFIKDSNAAQTTVSVAGDTEAHIEPGELRKRLKENDSKPVEDSKALAEIDRFSMCNNRII